MSYTSELPARTLLKPSEASAYFNVPLPTIYFWYRMGDIDGVKMNGKCLRIFSASLRDFLGSRSARDDEHLTSQERLVDTIAYERRDHVTTP